MATLRVRTRPRSSRVQHRDLHPPDTSEYLSQSNGQHAGQGEFGVLAHNPSQVLRLQHTIGNTAVQRLLGTHPSHTVDAPVEPITLNMQRKPGEDDEKTPSVMSARVAAPQAAGMLQRALWANAAAKFRTENGDPNIPNSEYLVTANGYVRYAPINMTRAREQVFHEGPRSFAYIDASVEEAKGAKYDAIWEPPISVDVDGDDVTFITWAEGYEQSEEVVGHITPQEGRTVFDFVVDDSTKELKPGQHVGHSVEDLGTDLPTLDDPDALEAARNYQYFLLQQYLMLKQQGRVTSYEDWNKQSAMTR